MDITRGRMPLLKVETDTYETAVRISGVKAALRSTQRTRIEIVKDLVEQNVDIHALIARCGSHTSARHVTPKQFLHRITDLARRDRRHIVLPEGREERILKASEVLLQRNIVDVTLLGNEAEIRDAAGRLGLKLAGAHIVDPARSPLRETFARRYQELRRPKKNPTWDLVGMTTRTGPTVITNSGPTSGRCEGPRQGHPAAASFRSQRYVG